MTAASPVSPLRLHDTAARGFASDNYSGIHPEVLEAIAAANGGHQVAYGGDAYTARLQEVVGEHFGRGAEAFPVFNGTGANVTGLLSMLPRWGAVVCATTAHINTDEGGAPERVAGIKLLQVPTDDGKLTPELIDREAWGWGDEHRAQPLAVSITQTTELGTVYTPAEVRAIADHAHERGMRLHMDARASPTRRPRSTPRSAPSPRMPASTSSASAAPRTACSTARRSWCSTRRRRRASPTSASSTCSSPRRCSS
ncbi:hypothetical protein MAFF212519_08280 [Clavibacter michiganensis]